MVEVVDAQRTTVGGGAKTELRPMPQRGAVDGRAMVVEEPLLASAFDAEVPVSESSNHLSIHHMQCFLVACC